MLHGLAGQPLSSSEGVHEPTTTNVRYPKLRACRNIQHMHVQASVRLSTLTAHPVPTAIVSQFYDFLGLPRRHSWARGAMLGIQISEVHLCVPAPSPHATLICYRQPAGIFDLIHHPCEVTDVSPRSWLMNDCSKAPIISFSCRDFGTLHGKGI
jgi:hypothetical protein